MALTGIFEEAGTSFTTARMSQMDPCSTGTNPTAGPTMSDVPPKTEVKSGINICRVGPLWVDTAASHVIQAPNWRLESCATNSLITKRRPSSRSCRTTGGVPRVNDRRVLNGIFWVLRSGAPWRGSFGRYWYSRKIIELRSQLRREPGGPEVVTGVVGRRRV